MIKINKVFFSEMPTYRTGTRGIRSSELNDENFKYYFEIKIEKLLDNTNLKSSSYAGKENYFPYVKAYFNDFEYDVERDFIELAKDIVSDFQMRTEDIEFDFYSFYVVICDCTIDDKHVIVAMKLDPKTSYKYDIENKELKQLEVLPPVKSSPVEAFIINTTDKKVMLVEKRVTFLDGEKDYYISTQILQNALEFGMSQKQTLNMLYKVINKVNDNYDIYDIDTNAVVNNAINNLQNIDGTKVSDIVSEVFEDEDAKEAANEILNDLNIYGEDKINYIDFKKLSKIKLNLDDEQIIEMSTEDYVNKDNGVLEIKDDHFGHKQIIINNINDVKVKI